MAGVVRCQAEKLVYLASLAARAKYRDSEGTGAGDISVDHMLPRPVVEERGEGSGDRVAELYSKNRGMGREEAMMEYLKVSEPYKSNSLYINSQNC